MINTNKLTAPVWLLLLPEEVTIKGEQDDRTIFLNGEYLSTVLSMKIRRHSPDGFSWGYTGSGPAQLALSILLEYLPVKLATEYYQEFKDVFISGLPPADFEQTVNLREIFYSFILNKTQ